MVHSFKVLLSLALIGGMHLSSWAQAEWPKAKPVTLLVAFAPGASSDIVARSLTQNSMNSRVAILWWRTEGVLAATLQVLK